MKRMIVTVPFNEEQKKKLCCAASGYQCLFMNLADVTDDILSDACALIGNVPVSQLEKQVSKADVIALSLPGTQSSYHLFNKNILLACKKNSYLMNVGRGTAIDTKCFLEKEVYEHFAGIWLDVCETEPLPVKDPLYFVPNLILTPHITGGYHLAQTMENILNITLHNLQAWKSQKDFIHIVDRKEGYSLR